jgi:hypothetical protein
MDAQPAYPATAPTAPWCRRVQPRRRRVRDRRADTENRTERSDDDGVILKRNM